MKKRILSIVLAVLMLVGILPISALAADAEPPESNITAVKSAQWVEGREGEGIAKVTIQVSGKAPEEWTVTDPTDIVLVMDRSLSMDDKATSNDRYDKMTEAKNAAKQFAKKMLESDKVRIAVVMYTKTAQTVAESAQSAFSNAYATVESRINSITTKGVSSENSGTNIQAGIHAARELLKASTANNKIMIVLSDGQPNYSFPFVATADYVGCNKLTSIGCRGIGMSGGQIQNRSSFTANYNDFIFEQDSSGATFELQDGNAYVKITCKEHDTTKYDYGVHDGSTYNGNTGKTDHSVATIWEAGQAENADVEIYSIGFGIGNNQNAIKTMKGIASAETKDHYFSAGMSANDIEEVFNSIARQVSKYVAYKPIVTDTISNDFEYYTDATLMASAGERDTITSSGQTVTWDLAAEQLDTTKHTLTFYVKYKNIANPAAPNTELPTNAGAQLKYAKEENGQVTETQNIANASVPSLSKTVSYTVTGQAPSGYMKPGDAHVWVGQKHMVAAAPESVDADGGTYTFEGWKANGETVSGELPITANITLTGEWKFEAAPTTKTLTITKNWHGLAETDAKPAVTFLLTQKKNDVPTNYTKTFMLDGEVDTGSEVVETAPWTATIEVPVKDTDGTEFKYSVKETKIGGTSIGAGAFNVTGTNPDNTSYIIGTWSVNSSGRPLDGTWTFTNKYTPKTPHTLTYQFVGENKPAVELPAAETLYENQQTDLAVVVAPDGWSFDGWYTDAGCTGDKVTSPYTMPGSNMTLYGKWEQKQPGVTVEKTAKRIRNGIEEDLPSGTGTVRVDDTIKYTVKATNTGNVELRNVSILECFGGRNKFKDDKTEQTVSGLFDRYGFTIAQTLAPEATATRTFTYVVTDADEDYGVIKNHLSMQEATYFDGQKDAKIPPKTAPSHEVTVEKPHGVAYEFEAGLPEDLQEYLPEEDTGRYYKGDSVAVRNPKQNSATIGNTKYTFAGWYVGTEKVASPYTMGETNVTFVGKWTEQPPETISITVEKSWDTNGSESVVKPNVISVQLTQNGKIFGNPVDLSADVEWKHTFNDLPKVDDNGNLYTYSVVEQGSLDASDGNNVIGMWKPLIVQTDTTITITNTFETAEEPEETIDITVRKSWESETDNEDLKLPESVEVELLRNDEIIETATLHWRTDNYGHTFKDLPKYDGEGNEYTYTVKELGDKIAYNSENERIGTWEDTYEKTAEGWDIKNTFVADETPELEDHEFTAHIVKRFENKSGKSPKATFTFVAALDDGTKVGRATISFSKGEVDAGDFERKDETMTVKLTDSQYEALKKDRIGRYLWIYEEDGEVDGVKYDTEPKKAYIYEKPVAWSLEFDEDGGLVFSVPDENTLYCLVGDEMVEDFVFTNTYKKPGEKGETIKSGPQLNRDDHVAYIMGYPDGTVQPEGEITRAEACTIFFRLLTESSRDYYFARTNDYSDVNRGDWFNNAISTLSNAGIVTGYNDGTFRPNQPITRGEMAKIIANFANLKYGGKTFTDLAGHWSKSYVELAAGNGWIAGYPDGSFRPDQKITRAETVTMINRVLDRVPAKESRLLSRSIMLTFPDNKPGDWYYIAIQEASNSHEYRRSVYETTGDEMWTKLIDNVDWTKLEK